jgi:hypothetical protein
MIKRLERLKNTDNKYMVDLRPTIQNGRKSTTWCIHIKSIYVSTDMVIIVCYNCIHIKSHYMFRPIWESTCVKIVV